MLYGNNFFELFLLYFSNDVGEHLTNLFFQSGYCSETLYLKTTKNGINRAAADSRTSIEANNTAFAPTQNFGLPNVRQSAATAVY